jgi:low affinity Fe/Cu permease
MYPRNSPTIIIAALVIAALIKLGVFAWSPGWAILIAIAVTAVAYVVTGLVRKN